MSDRASPPARAVITPGSVGNNTVHQAQSHAQTERPPRSATACPRCHAVSQPGVRFCRECGTPLLDPVIGATTEPQEIAKVRRCERCQALHEPDAAFCRSCGNPYDGSAAVRHTPHQAANAIGASQPAQQGARLVTLLKDGSEGRAIQLGESDGATDIGMSEGEATFPDDPYMSERHARVASRAGAYSLRDLDSVNGIYVRVRDSAELRDRDMILLGQQVLRFELLAEGELSLGPAFQGGVLVFGTPEAPRFARLVQYTTEGVGRDTYYLFRDETVIGRENGDIVFTDDPFLSRRHAALRVEQAGRRFTLHDLGSSNGTALRIRGEHVLRDGDQFRIGRHLFRFEAGALGGRAGR